MRIVDENDWALSCSLEAERLQRLLIPTSPKELLDRLITDAEEAERTQRVES